MQYYWDVHNHILPGVDDGSSCMEETVEMLRREYEQGVRWIILTPHFRTDMFEIGEEARIKVFAELKSLYENQLQQEMPGLHLMLGCELHLHPSQVKKAANPIYRMPGDRLVLTEFSWRDDYGVIEEKIDEMHQAGFRCIIAHAERYRLNAEDIRRLRQHPDTYIQVNAASLLGKEGLHQRMLTHKLIKEGLADLIGSDAHNVGGRPVNIGPCADLLTKKYGQTLTEKLLCRNPEEIFSGINAE